MVVGCTQNTDKNRSYGPRRETRTKLEKHPSFRRFCCFDSPPSSGVASLSARWHEKSVRVWRNGRRSRLKICIPIGSAGSNPAIRTIATMNTNYQYARSLRAKRRPIEPPDKRHMLRRGGRAAEGGGLLNRYRVSSSIVGSNPIPSATSVPEWALSLRYRSPQAPGAAGISIP